MNVITISESSSWYYNTSSTPRGSPPRNWATGKRARYKFRRDVSWRSPYMNGVKSKDKAARDLELAVKEARQWIQEVTGRQLDDNVRAALEDGTVLCELIQCIQPGSIKKINRRQTAIAHLDNLRQFLTACEQIGLKDSQLFDLTDLQEPGTLRMRSGGVKHTTADRRIRNVCITLYWLGRAVRDLPDYTGPQLNLESFREILDIPNFLKGYEQHVEMPPTSRSSQRQRQAFFLQGLDTGEEEKEEEHVPPPPLSASSRSSRQRQAFFLQGLDTGIEDEIEKKQQVEEKSVPESPSATARSSAQRQAFYLQGVVDTAPAEPTPPPAPKPTVAPKPKPVASKPKPFSKPNAGGRPARHMAMRNGGNDVTPDELLDKIQSTVDEMLSEFHPVTPSPTPSPIPQPEVPHHDAIPEEHIPSPSPPPPRLEDVKEEDEEALKHPDAQSHDLVDAVIVNGYPENRYPDSQYPDSNQYAEETDPQSFEPMFVTVHMTTQNGSYGLQVIGGIDTALPAQVERVVPGRPAESSGVIPGDYIVTVNQVDVTSLTHFELISLIKQCGTEGDMALGIVRPSNEGPAVTYSDEEITSPPPMFSRDDSRLLWEEEHRERERQRKEVAMMYVDDNKHLDEENEKEERVMHHVTSLVMAEKQMVLESNKTIIPPEHNHYQEEEEEHIATINSLSSPPPPLDSSGGSDGDIFAPVSSPTVDISLLSDFLVPQTSTHKERELDRSHHEREADKTHQEREVNKIHQEREVNKIHLEREVDKSHRVPATPLAAHEPPSSNVSTPMDTVRTISEEPEMNGIKVRPVQRTRWTPDSRDTTVRHESSFSSNPPSSDPRPQYYKPVHSSTPTSAPPASLPVKNLAATPATVVTKNVKRSSQGAPNCSHCLTAITRGPMMSIPERHLHFHSRCLTCTVCHSPLSMGYGHTTVFLRQTLPHCASCYSTDSGLKVTTC